MVPPGVLSEFTKETEIIKEDHKYQTQIKLKNVFYFKSLITL